MWTNKRKTRNLKWEKDANVHKKILKTSKKYWINSKNEGRINMNLTEIDFIGLGWVRFSWIRTERIGLKCIVNVEMRWFLKLRTGFC